MYIQVFMFAPQMSFQIEQFELDLKKAPRSEHEYVNIHTPPPPPYRYIENSHAVGRVLIFNVVK